MRTYTRQLLLLRISLIQTFVCVLMAYPSLTQKNAYPLGGAEVGTVRVTGNRVVEAPSIAMVGGQPTFTVAYLPASTATFHLACKGVELKEGQDYILDERLVRITRSLDESQLGSVQVLYQSQFALPEQVPASAKTDQTAVIEAAIIQLALREASAFAADPFRGLPSESHELMRERPLVPASLNSMSLLVRNLERSRDLSTTSSLARNRTKLGKRALSLQGIEGLGDTDLQLDYGLVSSSLSETRRLMLGKHPADTPRSLMMLQQMLDKGRSQ